MEYGRFEEFLLMVGLAAAAVALLQRFRLPGIVGYLLVGALFGPYAIGLFSDLDDVQFIAQLGVVFLLFTIGLEFSLAEVNAMRRTLLPLGLGQVVLTTLLIALAAWAFGFAPAAAFAVGAVLAQSSTTLIGKQLIDQGEQGSRPARLAIGISVFQDVTAIPFVIAIPALAAGGYAWIGDMGQALVLALAVAVALWGSGRWVLRPLFRSISRTRSMELFTLVAVAVAVGAAWITEQVGLSLALGGFLAGMVLGETEFQHQVEAAVRPFRDLLLGLFFITIGMQIDLVGLPGILHWVVLLAVGSVALKIALVWALCVRAGVDRQCALRTGLMLAVGGEFGFALLALALDAGLLTDVQTQILLGSVFVSMALTPLLIRYNGAIADRFLGGAVAGAVQEGAVPGAADVPGGVSGHVVLCGFGRVGQNIARFLDVENIPWVAVDVDTERVRAASDSGAPVFYGDGREPALLDALNPAEARLIVVTWDDLSTAEEALMHIRDRAADVPVLVRARDELNLDRLLAAGATETVSETLEASLMLVSHALHLSGVDSDRILNHMQEARANRYQLLREFFGGRGAVSALHDPRSGPERLDSLVIDPDSKWVGQPLSALSVPEDVRITAVVRHGVRGVEPDADMVLRGGDVILLYGMPDRLKAVVARLEGRIQPAD